MNKMDVATEKKDQIVRATVDCIAKYGYHSFSMQDVAKKAGVSKGIIHYYFLNKDELMISVLDKVATDIELTLQTDMESIKNPKKQLEIFIEICMNIVQSTREYYQVNMDFWTQITQKDGVKEIIAQHYAKFRKTCSHVIEDGINQGIFRDVNPNEYSSYIISVIDGLSLQWLFDEKAFDYNKISKKIKQFIMDGLIP